MPIAMSDDEPRSCSFCNRFADDSCRRCGRAYCKAHGRELCEVCLSPSSALPSPAAYKGSLMTLAIAVVAGLLVLIHPLSLPGEHRLAKGSGQNPALLQPGTAPGNRASGSVVPTPLPGVAPNSTSPALRSYTVVLNDTLTGIAQNFGTTVVAIQAANPGVNESNLKAGQELLIPPSEVPARPLGSPSPAAALSATPTSTP